MGLIDRLKKQLWLPNAARTTYGKGFKKSATKVDAQPNLRK
jgi:hypothetical protein